jgi:hypothetical protein
MVARVASFEGIDVGEAERRMDEAEALIRPVVEALSGYRGHLELLSQGGDVVSITLFESAADAEAAESTFEEELPSRLGELFSGWAGRRTRVEVYDVVAEGRA